MHKNTKKKEKFIFVSLAKNLKKKQKNFKYTL